VVTRYGHRRSRGQIVPIAALIAILLLGFVALVVDGGRGYLDRRDLQSTADMAALSGAAQLGRTIKTNPNLSKARLAAVHEVENNLPDTSSSFSGSADATGCSGGCIDLTHGYKMDVSATITRVYVKIYHSLSLTFGIPAGFGPSITPAAEATAINGVVPFAVILFRTACTGAVSNGCGNLVESGGTTNVNVTSADYPTDTADALTNESICPAPGVLTFSNEGNQYAFNPTGNGQFPSASCGTNSNITGTLCSGSPPSPSPCVSGTVPMLQWNQQIADPQYPEPQASTTSLGDPKLNDGSEQCLTPGTYASGITVSKGDLILQPQAIYRVTGGGFDVGNNGNVWTVDRYLATHPLGTACGYSLLSKPSDSGAIVEMQPQNTSATNPDGAKNQLTVHSGGTFRVSSSPKYDHVAIYVEDNPGGEQVMTGAQVISYYTGTTGGGSNVVQFTSSGVYQVSGTVYGYADNMTFNGQGTGDGVGQILAWTVTLTGGGNINQLYDPSQLPQQFGLLK